MHKTELQGIALANGTLTKSHACNMFAEIHSLSTQNTDYPREGIVAVTKAVHVDAVVDEMKIGQITNRWSCRLRCNLVRRDFVCCGSTGLMRRRSSTLC
jgi:hypothetical protein